MWLLFVCVVGGDGCLMEREFNYTSRLNCNEAIHEGRVIPQSATDLVIAFCHQGEAEPEAPMRLGDILVDEDS